MYAHNVRASAQLSFIVSLLCFYPFQRNEILLSAPPVSFSFPMAP